jgi:hypothetical protein
MSKKHYIELAKRIAEHNKLNGAFVPFNLDHLAVLADWLEEANPKFDRVRWKEFIEKQMQEGK